MSRPRRFGQNRFLRAVYDRGLFGWTFKIYVGRGAGYGWWIFNRRFFIPTGWTFWIGRNTVGPKNMYVRKPWSVGLTKRGNVAPWIQA